MKKNSDRISGSLGYYNNFSILDMLGNQKDIMDQTKYLIKKNLSDTYSNICYDEESNETLKNIGIAQRFLHGGKLHFSPRRLIINDFKVRHDMLPIFDSVVMLTIFEELGIASFTINLSFKDANTDQVVFLKQCFGSGEKFNIEYLNGTVEKMSISELFQQLIKTIGVPINASNKSSIIEVNEFCDYDDIDDILKSESNRLYGLLTGDEGWEYTSKETVDSRFIDTWGSRRFIKFIAFGSNFMLINLNRGKIQQSYEQHQNKFTKEYYNSINDYFSLKSNLAGLNHGIMFSVETVMAIKTITNDILDKQTYFRTNKVGNFKLAIKRTQAYRRDLMLTLNKLEDVGMASLGELENLILRSQNIDPIIDKIKYLLELLESELTLIYSERTNKLVNILTIFGLLFTVIQTIISIYTLF